MFNIPATKGEMTALLSSYLACSVDIGVVCGAEDLLEIEFEDRTL